MHPSGVKRISSWFRIRPPSEEKAPFANRTFTNNGSIAKDSKMTVEEGKKCYGSRDLSDSSLMSNEKEFEEKPKMSLLRKFCFLMSLNGWVAYVAVLLWAIPCRHPLCIPPQKDWNMDLNLLLTTNMETTKYSGLPYSVIFGFSDESGPYLASLAISDGKMMWNQSTGHILRHVFCQFDNALTFNQYPGCIMTADNFIGAFDASSGNIVWQQNLSVSESDIIHTAAIAKGRHNTPYILGVSNDFLFVLNANNGTTLPAVALPCSWSPIDVKLVGPWKLRKRKLWTLVCQFGDSVEVWTLEQGELLSPQEKSSGKRLRDDVNFSLLFRQDSYIGSIDLAGDVTRTLDSLALSWADSVVMVTAQAPFHHLRKTWERRFSGLLGDSIPVTSLVSGHYTDPKKIEIAVAVQDGLNTTIHILRKNGTFVASTNLGRGSVMSMERIPGGQHETDVLVVESVHVKHGSNFSQEPTDQTTRFYFTMQYVGKEMKYQNLISAEVYESTLSQFSEGIVDLLTASKDSNGNTKISRIMITRSSIGSICDSEVRRNTSTMLMD